MRRMLAAVAAHARRGRLFVVNVMRADSTLADPGASLPANSPSITFRNANRGSCLDVTNGNNTDFTVIVYKCNGQDNQKWRLNGDGTINPTHASWLCLETLGEGRSNGTKIDPCLCRWNLIDRSK